MALPTPPPSITLEINDRLGRSVPDEAVRTLISAYHAASGGDTRLAARLLAQARREIPSRSATRGLREWLQVITRFDIQQGAEAALDAMAHAIFGLATTRSREFAGSAPPMGDAISRALPILRGLSAPDLSSVLRWLAPALAPGDLRVVGGALARIFAEDRDITRLAHAMRFEGALKTKPTAWQDAWDALACLAEADPESKHWAEFLSGDIWGMLFRGASLMFGEAKDQERRLAAIQQHAQALVLLAGADVPSAHQEWTRGSLGLLADEVGERIAALMRANADEERRQHHLTRSRLLRVGQRIEDGIAAVAGTADAVHGEQRAIRERLDALKASEREAIRAASSSLAARFGPAWSALSPSARTSLACGEMLWQRHLADDEFDLALVAVAYWRAVEIEFSRRVRAPLARRLAGTAPVSTGTRQVPPERLARSLAGEWMYILEATAAGSNAHVSTAVHDLWPDRAPFVLRELPTLLRELLNIRNPAMHEGVLWRQSLVRMRDIILPAEGEMSILARLPDPS